jgi:SAM-dependent methyltransferase
MEMELTAVQRFATSTLTRILAIIQSISLASRMFRPEIRLQDQAEMLRDYVRQGDSILDVGCGTGYLSKYLKEMHAVEPIGVDVKDFREHPIPFHSFDGTSIPFPERAFDHVLISYALHHAHDPGTLIQECRRVARRTVIVFEDLPDHLFGRLMLFIHVSIFALSYPFRPAKGEQYRSALNRLGDQATNIIRIAIPPKWLHILYPRFLVVYALSND